MQLLWKLYSGSIGIEYAQKNHKFDAIFIVNQFCLAKFYCLVILDTMERYVYVSDETLFALFYARL